MSVDSLESGRADGGADRARMLNAMSIDVEDWFQVENSAAAIPRDSWPSLPLRVVANVELLLDLFAARRARATFFVLGWLAERVPDLVRRIAAAGHEIGSHGWSHAPIWRLSRQEFKREIAQSRALLQGLSGQGVRGYRAPTFSITRDTLWALDDLEEAGYSYDSSVFPIRHDRYGIPDAPLEVHRRGGGLVEVPLSVAEICGIRVPVAGGGYLRLVPASVTAGAIRRINRAGRPAVVYVHPWEFDPGQPEVPGLGRLRRLRHRVGLGRNLAKLDRLLAGASFGAIEDVLAVLGFANASDPPGAGAASAPEGGLGPVDRSTGLSG